MKYFPSRSLIQEEQLSVSGKIMCTSTTKLVQEKCG